MGAREMRDLNLETFFWARLQRLIDIRRDPSDALGEGGLRLVDRCIYSMISDLRELGVDLREAPTAECRDD